MLDAGRVEGALLPFARVRFERITTGPAVGSAGGVREGREQPIPCIAADGAAPPLTESHRRCHRPLPSLASGADLRGVLREVWSIPTKPADRTRRTLPAESVTACIVGGPCTEPGPRQTGTGVSRAFPAKVVRPSSVSTARACNGGRLRTAHNISALFHAASRAALTLNAASVSPR